MQAEFNKAMDKLVRSGTKKPILVAVSGGVDSMVLATLLHKSGYCMHVAHCNYQLRGADSEADEQLVRDWCEMNLVPFHTKRIPIKDMANSSNRSIQMVARDERYAFFEELMNKTACEVTVLAHHADDRIESVIINVLRGTGVRGLQGMPSKRDAFVRPLLNFRKSEIQQFASDEIVPFRDDRSNFEADYLRNWLRLRVIPMLLAIDGSVTEKLLSLCLRTENQLDNYEPWVAEKLALLGSESELNLESLTRSAVPFTLLKERLGPLGFSSDQVFEVLSLMNAESGSYVSSDSHRVVRDRKQLLIEPISSDVSEPNLQFELLDRQSISTLMTTSNVALLDAELIQRHKLRLRKWQEGDRFKPLGMKRWKKLSDFFIDEKLSLPEKDRVWILTQNESVVWIVGHRIDDRFKVRGSTQKVLKLTVLQ